VHPTTVTEPSTQRPDRTRYVLATLVGLTGFVWVLQGLGVIGGGFMVGDLFWSFAGAALLAVAIGYAALPRLRRR
jgi:hypothetical protein